MMRSIWVSKHRDSRCQSVHDMLQSTRDLRESGGFSCQLVFAQSKIVPKDMSMTRAEVLAASLNAVSVYVVKLSFGDMYKKCWKLTDSQVVLHWIGCTRSTLKMWVRNRVIEINRLVYASLWRYVESRNMTTGRNLVGSMKCSPGLVVPACFTHYECINPTIAKQVMK